MWRIRISQFLNICMKSFDIQIIKYFLEFTEDPHQQLVIAGDGESVRIHMKDISAACWLILNKNLRILYILYFIIVHIVIIFTDI